MRRRRGVVVGWVCVAALAQAEPTRVKLGLPSKVSKPGSGAATVEPSGIVRVFWHGDAVSLFPEAPGQAVVRLTSADGGVERLEVVVDADETPERALTLQEKELSRLVIPGLVRWSIGDETVLRVKHERPDAGFVAIQGVKAGSTSFEAFTADGSRRRWPVTVESERLAARNTLQLQQGRSLVLSVEDAARLSLEGSVASLKTLSKRTVMVHGAAPGSAMLREQLADGTTRSWLVVVSAR